jgi:hypothetical protein
MRRRSQLVFVDTVNSWLERALLVVRELTLEGVTQLASCASLLIYDIYDWLAGQQCILKTT